MPGICQREISWLDHTDWGVVVATVLGPLLAVQATRWLDDRKARRERQTRIFSVLMSTRRGSYQLSGQHVEALNLVEVEFADLPKVREASAAYVAHVNAPPPREISANYQWNENRQDLLARLLHAISDHLRFGFSLTQIKTGGIALQAHLENELALKRLRDATTAVMDGSRPLDVRVVEAPAHQTASDRARPGADASNSPVA